MNALRIEEVSPPVEKTERARRGMRIAGVVLVVAVTAMITSALIYVISNREIIIAYDGVVDQQDEVIGTVCDVAGDKVVEDPTAQQACENVSRGQPAVPLPPEVDPPSDGDDGVGISFTRQIDECFVEVGLTNGMNNRFGPFCGAPGPSGVPGSTGPTGPVGPTGESGEPGTDGENAPPAIGIRDIQTNGCMVDVLLTDDSVRTIGPFCGTPPGEYTEVRADGSEKRCTRDGGADTAPRYTCTEVAPPPPVTTTTTSEGGLLPTD